ncbi:VanZ family protein [Nitratidesulfovibrio sp. HK-II]|uniref:VanZ family protein n=1 Tax=Nitratidesulfovibrio sp. HK-II TaxID=2009266 RepID=UPI000E2FEEDA|nr:VanZ family protein [Nitratidesulfovibrio sp. HK-II]GBO96612.1 hypothetical protein RVX_1651 [Nitratidesulfovibrio sp. HK-II]
MPDFRKHGSPTSSLLAWWASHPWRVACTRCAWGLAVTVVVRQSLIPQPDMLLDVPQIDKLWHTLAYLLLALLAAESFRGRQSPPSSPSPPALAPAARRAAWSMALLGVGLELAQAYVPGRVASAADMAANATGTWLGVLLAGHLARRMAACAQTVVDPTDRGAPHSDPSASPASPACSAAGQRRHKPGA